MARPRLLTAEDVKKRHASLSAWSVRQDRLQRDIDFGSFERAFGFMTAVALIAQRMDHHPEFHNSYTRVSLSLWTHDAGGLTALDFDLAEAAERLVAAFQSPQ